MEAQSGLLPHANTAAPKFERSSMEPAGLRSNIVLLRKYRIPLLTTHLGDGKTNYKRRRFSETQLATKVCCLLRLLPNGDPGELIARGIATALARSVAGERSRTTAILEASYIKFVPNLPHAVLSTNCF